MLYTEFKVDNEVYKLRLRTRDIITLEKLINENPLSIFGNGDTIPTVTTMVYILHTSMQAYHHGISLNDAFDIFDKWLADDNSVTDFLAVIVDLYKVSGIIKNDKEAKN